MLLLLRAELRVQRLDLRLDRLAPVLERELLPFEFFFDELLLRGSTYPRPAKSIPPGQSASRHP